MAFLVLGANSVSGYTVKNSLRFNSGSSDSLSRTPSSATNRKTWTWSFWFKISYINPNGMYIFGASQDGNNRTAFGYNYASVSGDAKIWFHNRTASTFNTNLITTQVFRDISAWYHLVVAVDTTQATASDRAKIYLNGSQITALDTATYPSQNTDTWVNSANAHAIGKYSGGASDFVDGYIADAYLIDGQALTPSSFGETDFDTGIWKPKAYTGTYGTNGFYLKFANSASLGTDSSGNGNTFTVNNLTSIDQTTDTPTNNFATFNSLSKNNAGTVTFSEGNLKTAHSGTNSRYTSYSTIGVSSGKWYTEFKVDVSAQPDVMTGVGYDQVIENQNRNGGYLGEVTGTWGYFSSDGYKYVEGTASSYGNTYGAGDIIGIALDLDNNYLYFSKNGTFQNSGVPTSGATGTGGISITANKTYFMACCHATTTTRTSTYSANFGSPIYSANSYTDSAGFGNFSYSVPSGYFSLCTKNLAQYG